MQPMRLHDQRYRFVSWFRYSAATLLWVTALAKLISATGSARILRESDPVLILPLGVILGLVGFLELFVGGLCFYSKKSFLWAGVLVWMSTNFIAYRVALHLAGGRRQCKCLGTITDALHISASTSDLVAKLILAYLFVGGCLSLLYACSRRTAFENPRVPVQDHQADTAATL